MWVNGELDSLVPLLSVAVLPKGERVKKSQHMHLKNIFCANEVHTAV